MPAEPEKKRCQGPCKKLKPVTEFSRRGCGHQPLCKECNREYQRGHYQRNAATYRARAAETRRTAKLLARRWIWDYLTSHPCMDCGESDPVVLDFDHRDPRSKLSDVSKLVSQGRKLALIEAEVAKCDVRCANCHRRRTALQYGFTSKDPLTWLAAEVESAA